MHVLGLVETKCPHCSEEEDWEHMILYQSISDLKEQYVNDLKAKLGAVVIDEIDEAEIEMIIEDIKTYVMGAPNEYIITQHIIGMELIFKG